MVRVLIADDDPVMRMVLATIIGAAPELALAGEAADALEAIELARELRPDVAVLDVEMPGGGGARAADEIRVLGVRVVGLSAHARPAFEMDAYVVKGAPPAAVIAAITSVAR